jgi:hypothetical protein
MEVELAVGVGEEEVAAVGVVGGEVAGGRWAGTAAGGEEVSVVVLGNGGRVIYGTIIDDKEFPIWK